MSLKVIADNRAALLACEALGFLHNIGKLDSRFPGSQFSYKKISTWASDHAMLTAASAYNTNKEITEALCTSLFGGAPLSGQASKIWDSFSSKDNALTRLSGIVEQLGGNRHELLSGFFLIQQIRKNGVELDNDTIVKFVKDYCEQKTGNNYSAVFNSGLPVIGNAFRFDMLLNLFWDDFHWRTIKPDNLRDDNLTFWLGKEYEDFSRFARIMAVCHEAISRGDKGEGKNGVNPAAGYALWTNVFGTGEQKFAKQNDLKTIIATGDVSAVIDRSCGVASDGQLPINDVSLHDYCDNFGGFLKTVLAKILLEERYPEPHELRWRLLYFRYNGGEWIGRGGRLADAVARRRVWGNVLAGISDFLEVELPLAKCIYHDTSGAFYLAPDIAGLLELTCPNDGLTLAAKIRQISVDASAGEIAVTPRLSDPMPGYNVKIAALMQDDDPMPADPEVIESSWKSGGREVHAEGCTVCGLRPIVHIPEVALKQRVCPVCHDRRTGRLRKWIENKMAGTIWTSELADANGRCALIAGRLEIQDWLSGDLFQSLDYKWTDGDATLPPGPSFTRVRDVWQTTESFWKKANDFFADPAALAPLGVHPGRWQIILEGPDTNLNPNHAYEIATKAGRLQVVCTALSGRTKTLVVVDRRAPRDLDKFEQLLPASHGKRVISLYMRGGYGGVDIHQGDFISLEGPSFVERPFAPYLNILADPLRFFAVVPADRAMAAVKWLHTEYTKTFNRVQDRLAVRFGIVYYPEKTPIFTVIDAGLKMIKEPAPWVDSPIVANAASPDERTIQLADGSVFCYRRKLCGKDDIWYVRPRLDGSYTSLESLPEEAKPTIAYLPSALDIVYLNETSRRHQLHYSDDGKRDDPDFGGMPLRPAEIVNLEQIWSLLNKLSRSQLGQLEEARIYANGELDGVSAEAKHHFLENALATTGDGWWQKMTDNERKLLQDSLTSDRLWTVLAYRLHLLKEKPAAENPVTKEEEI